MKKIGISLIILSVSIWLFYFIMVLPNTVTQSNPDIQMSSMRILIIAVVIGAIGVCLGVYLVKKSKSKF